MMRRVFALLVLLLVSGTASALSVSVEYGRTESVDLELADSVPLVIGIEDIPAHVHRVFVDVSSDLMEKVYCAPGVREEEENRSWDADFVCVVFPGSYSGRLVFRPADIDVDEDGEYLAEREDTVVKLSVRQKDVWYTYYGSTNRGGSITVGPYRVSVEDVEPVSAEVTVLKGETPVWGGLVFIGQEVNVSDDFVFTFNGYSERRGVAFFTFRTKFVAAVSSSIEEYYLAVPSPVYAGEQNTASVPIATNCEEVLVCADSNCTSYRVDDGFVYASLSPGKYTVRCADADVSAGLEVLPPAVVVREVEKDVNPSAVCPSWFRNLPAPTQRSYCSSVCALAGPSSPQVPPGDGSGDLGKWALLALVLAVVGYFVWKKYREGGLSGGKSKMQFEEVDKEIEAVPDVEG